MISDNDIDQLFIKYFNKTASTEERAELMRLISESGSDQELGSLMENAYRVFVPLQNPFDHDQEEKMLKQIHLKINNYKKKSAPLKIRNKNNWFKYAVAASVVIFITVCGYLLTSRYSQKEELVAIDFNPGGNKAVLTLSDGSKIDLDDAKNGNLAVQGNIVINKTTDGKIYYDTSGVASSETENKTLYNTLTTPKGGQYRIVLPDGTKAWLNSVSSISFPTKFNGNERHVKITGEVYLEVAKDKTKPFFVKTGDQLVEVLGTHFNINSYDDEPDIKTTLLEGAVKVHNINNNFIITLRPGQQSSSNKEGSIKIKNVDIEQTIAWKNGLFQINDANIETIMRQASRWYDVEIEYEGKIPEKKFTGKIKRDVKASEFLQMLSYFDVNFRIEGRKIIIKGN